MKGITAITARERTLAVWIVTTLLVGVAWAAPAAAQTDEPIGALDSRTAPVLENGTFTDSFFTGSSLWYGLLNTNNLALEISASVVDPPESGELTVNLALVGPSLEVAGEAEDELLTSATWSGGETALWFVRVDLVTTDAVGVEHEVEISVEGANEGALVECSGNPDCDADERAADAAEELATAQQAADERAAEEAEATAEQPAPEPATGTKTEVPWIWVVILGLLAGIFLVLGARSRRSREREPDSLS